MDIPTAVDDLRRALIETWGNLPVELRERLFKLQGHGVSPVDMIVRSSELIYARRSKVPLKMKRAAARGFRVAALYGFHALDKDLRGEKAALNLEGALPAAEAPEPVRELTEGFTTEPLVVPTMPEGTPILGEETPTDTVAGPA